MAEQYDLNDLYDFFACVAGCTHDLHERSYTLLHACEDPNEDYCHEDDGGHDSYQHDLRGMDNPEDLRSVLASMATWAREAASRIDCLLADESALQELTNNVLRAKQTWPR